MYILSGLFEGSINAFFNVIPRVIREQGPCV